MKHDMKHDTEHKNNSSYDPKEMIDITDAMTVFLIDTCQGNIAKMLTALEIVTVYLLSEIIVFKALDEKSAIKVHTLNVRNNLKTTLIRRSAKAQGKEKVN